MALELDPWTAYIILNFSKNAFYQLNTVWTVVHFKDNSFECFILRQSANDINVVEDVFFFPRDSANEKEITIYRGGGGSRLSIRCELIQYAD